MPSAPLGPGGLPSWDEMLGVRHHHQAEGPAGHETSRAGFSLSPRQRDQPPFRAVSYAGEAAVRVTPASVGLSQLQVLGHPTFSCCPGSPRPSCAPLAERDPIGWAALSKSLRPVPVG